MTKMQLSVKNVEKQVFQEFKADAVKRGLSVGGALTLAMHHWLIHKKRRVKKSIVDWEATDWGKGTEHTSEQIDEILYGEE